MKKFLPFIFILLMLVAILGFSSQDGDSSNGLSKMISHKIERFLNDRGNNGYDSEEINFIIRKLAHFTEYLILAVLLATGFTNLLKYVIPSIMLSGIICVGLAFFDELFQGYSVDRTSSLFDVMIDSSGAMVGLVAVGIFALLKVNASSSNNVVTN